MPRLRSFRRLVQEAGATVYQQAGAQRAPRNKTVRNLHSLKKSQQGKKTVEAEYKVVDEDKQ